MWIVTNNSPQTLPKTIVLQMVTVVKEMRPATRFPALQIAETRLHVGNNEKRPVHDREQAVLIE